MDQTTLDFLKTVGAGQLRHALTGAGAALVAKGVLQSDQEGAFVQIGMGAGAYLVGAVWSWWQKDGRDLAKAQLARLRTHVAAIPTVAPMESTVATVAKVNAQVTAAKAL